MPLGNAVEGRGTCQSKLRFDVVRSVRAGRRLVLWTSVLGDRDGYWESACATSLYVRLTSWYSCDEKDEGQLERLGYGDRIEHAEADGHTLVRTL